MQDLPHQYHVSAIAGETGSVVLNSEGLPGLTTGPPPEFGGEPGHWSPETLLAGAVADCFVLSFRGIARASRFTWTHLECQVEAVLERPDGVTRFTTYKVMPTLTIPKSGSVEKAQKLLEKAEKYCLITNSLLGEKELICQIKQDDSPNPDQGWDEAV